MGLSNVQETQRGFLSTLWNVYSFYVLYAEIDQFNPLEYKEFKPTNIMDKWIISKLNTLTKEVDESIKEEIKDVLQMNFLTGMYVEIEKDFGHKN